MPGIPEQRRLERNVCRFEVAAAVSEPAAPDPERIVRTLSKTDPSELLRQR